jgi:hypothetical protein
MTIGRLIALRPRRLNGAPATPVQKAKMDSRLIGQSSHEPSEGIYFPHQMTFGQPSDGRIAGHLGDRLEVERDQAGFEAHPSRGVSGLASRMAGSDDDHIEDVRRSHGPLIFRCKTG